MCSTINVSMSFFLKEPAAINWQQGNLNNAGVRRRRFSVSAESVSPEDTLVLDTAPKSNDEKTAIRAATSEHFVFKLLNSEQYEQVIQAMSKKQLPKHSVIAQQGAYADR